MPEPKTVEVYQTNEGERPFDSWLKKVRDLRAVARIRTQLTKLKLGLLGDTKPVGNSVHELRVHTGKGYRVYFANDDEQLVILLSGGDKSSQQDDIEKAKEYWNDYKARKKMH